jgi:hypothetical protein
MVWRAMLRFWKADRGLSVFLVLLVVLVFVLPALMPVGPLGRLTTDLVFSGLLVAGTASTSERRWVLFTVSAVVTAALLLRWVGWLLPAADLPVEPAWTSLVTCALFSCVVLAQVFSRGPVTVHRIQGAVAVYLLLGLAWASAYELLSLRHPDAFTGAAGSGEGAGENWLYFSFVTLTTMGYGDITPVHPAARSLATLEALVGQLYPAILLARLVSLEVQSKTAR